MHIGWKDAERAKYNALGKNVYKNDGNWHENAEFVYCVTM